MLLQVGETGQIKAGAMSARLRRLWEIVRENVGTDPGGVLDESWANLTCRFSALADVRVGREGWIWLFVADASRIPDLVEQAIPADDL